MKSVHELMSLQGRVAAITGGAGHIGCSFAQSLAELGCDICILDVAKDRAEEVASSLRDTYRVKVSSFVADITDEREVAEMAQHIAGAHQRLDILINNAAYPSLSVAEDGKKLEDQTLEQWEPNVNVCLRGTFLTTRAVTPLLRQSKSASIVNIASIYGVVGPDMRLYDGLDMGNSAWYAAAKGGIVQLTRYLASTLAPSIRVNCIAPGGVWRNQPESFRVRYERRTPLQRMAVEEDLCGAAVYFASDLSSYVTGQVLLVDGGWTSW